MSQPTQDKKDRDPTPTSDKTALQSEMRTSRGEMEGGTEATKDMEGQGVMRAWKQGIV